MNRSALGLATLAVCAACTRPDAPAPRQSSTPETTSASPASASAPPGSAARVERLFHPPEGELFTKKRPPRSGDWLDRFEEPGQSFLAYQSSSPLRPTAERKKIVLQPLGAFGQHDQQLMHTLR